MPRKPSALDLALRYDLTLDFNPYSVEVTWYDTTISETHSFREHCNTRAERKAALRQCVDRAVKKATAVTNGAQQ
jgi:hypothetical protein